MPVHSSEPVNVFVTYEVLQSGRRAQEACAKFANLENRQRALRQCTWKFDLLQIPGLRTIAAREAAEADAILVATYEENGLPPAFLEWADGCLNEPSRTPNVMLALLGPSDPANPAPTQTELQLQQIAERSGAKYYALHARGPIEDEFCAPDKETEMEDFVRRAFRSILN